jgi:hypothetical protein
MEMRLARNDELKLVRLLSADGTRELPVFVCARNHTDFAKPGRLHQPPHLIILKQGKAVPGKSPFLQGFLGRETDDQHPANREDPP